MGEINEQNHKKFGIVKENVKIKKINDFLFKKFSLLKFKNKSKMKEQDQKILWMLKIIT